MQRSDLNYFSDVVDNEDISCVGLNEDSSSKFIVNRGITFVLQYLTEVQLYFTCFEELDGKEGILLNDEIFKDEVAMDTS